MRKLIVGALILSLAAAGCARKKRHANPSATVEEEGELTSRVLVSDPASASQLLSGFHAVENPSWRWSMRKFGVTLAPPAAGVEKGARLELKYAIPDGVFESMRGTGITATVMGWKSPPCRIEKPGAASCVFDVPPAALKYEGLIVEFELDRVIPSSGDARELGLIVSEIGFLTQ